MYTQRVVVKLNVKKNDAFVLPVKEWAREQRGKLFCHGCFKLRRDLYKTPIDVPIKQLPKGTAYNVVSDAGGAIIHVKLLEFLMPFLGEHVVGRCLRPDGSVMPDYRTICLCDRIVVRGNKTADYYVCKVCGAIGSGWGDSPYVLCSEVPDAEVFQEYHDTLIVSEDVGRRLPWRKFSSLEPFIIEVLDEPLPDDPYPYD